MNSYMYGGFSTCCDMIHFHFINKKKYWIKSLWLYNFLDVFRFGVTTRGGQCNCAVDADTMDTRRVARLGTRAWWHVSRGQKTRVSVGQLVRHECF